MVISTANSRPIWLVTESSLGRFMASQGAAARAVLSSQSFNAERHRVVLLPNDLGEPTAAVVLGLGALESLDQLR